MIPYRRWTCLLSAALLFSLVAAPGVRAGEPTDQLRTHVDQVVKILDSPERGKPTEKQAIRNEASKIFDFQETAKRSLGPHWQQRTPAQREEFTKLFTDLLEHSYLSKIETYSGEKVTYVGETIEGDQAVVKTKIVTKKGTEVPVDYRMVKEGNNWRVYDVIIEGVSLVSNYRSQFNKIIRTSSYDDLVAKMRAKELGPQTEDSKDSKEAKSKRPS